MRLLFIGDVVGRPGRRAVASQLPALVRQHRVDLVVANAENIADNGAGVTPQTAGELFDCGVHVLTNGNHAWDQAEALDYIVTAPRLLRPYNYPAGTPGAGWYVAEAGGHRVGILNVMGNVYMQPPLACPFGCVDQALANKSDDIKMVLVDLHAEATSEKTAMGWYLDGRVSAVVGTHTHVPTADERVLPRGTGYITDVGMTGCYDSVIGMDTQGSLKRFVQKLPVRFDVAAGRGTLSAVLLDLDEHTGTCRSIRRISASETDAHAESLMRAVG